MRESQNRQCRCADPPSNLISINLVVHIWKLAYEIWPSSYCSFVAEIGRSSKSGISTGALVGIVIGAIAFAVTLSAIVTILILRIRLRDYHAVSRRRHGEFSYHELTSVLLFFSLTCLKCSIKIAASKISIKIDGVRAFSYGELSSATNNFSTSAPTYSSIWDDKIRPT